MSQNEIGPPDDHNAGWKAAVVIFGLLVIETWILISHRVGALSVY